MEASSRARARRVVVAVAGVVAAVAVGVEARVRSPTGEPGEPGEIREPCGREIRGRGRLVSRSRSSTPTSEDEYLEEEVATLPQHSTFGSVWESQLGVAPTSAISATAR